MVKIAVQYTVVVTKVDTTAQLEEEALHDGRFDAAIAYIKILLKVLVQELKHKCELALRVDHVI